MATVIVISILWKGPRIFDMQIFAEESECTPDPDDPAKGPYSKNCVHPGGWGTILVGAMGFGGAPITAGQTWDLITGSLFPLTLFWTLLIRSGRQSCLVK